MVRHAAHAPLGSGAGGEAFRATGSDFSAQPVKAQGACGSPHQPRPAQTRKAARPVVEGTDAKGERLRGELGAV